MPNVDVSRNRIVSNAGTVSAEAMTLNKIPGRFFFIWMGTGENIERPGREQLLDAIAHDFTGNIVEIRFQDPNHIVLGRVGRRNRRSLSQ